MPSLKELKARKRSDYPYILEYRTRWSDNDMYAHMNNAMYTVLYDAVINTYLVEACGMRPHHSPQHALVVHSQIDYFGSISFPKVAELALRVARLGHSSVTYDVALFEKGVDEVRSVGEFVQVFVERETGRPNAATGMSAAYKEGLEKILVQGDAKSKI
ncbi:thioesterase superfamily protein [Diplogelasinospora grovesii]|uniref:Thioesterase superfamily protein n=1 Tax=Diplogelasinospora grovesii TaxID=303347 RepID=A0AAN6S2B7_9PEZI|nr:thioesterase superfamily protein [Diplogelasinospora grovesii]